MRKKFRRSIVLLSVFCIVIVSILLFYYFRPTKNVVIVFKNTSDLSYVAVEAFEITYKLKTAYLRNNFSAKISAQEVESFDNLPRENLFIALVPPSISDETAIRVSNNVIFIKGENLEKLDLATVKFLMIILGIKIDPEAINPIYSVNYDKIELKFRADLREANKIPVYPNESYIYELLWK
jgi:hypothetical protein